MTLYEKQVAMSNAENADSLLRTDLVDALNPDGSSKRELGAVAATFLTTLVVFGIFFVQGIILAQILGPVGRGAFGTALYFPRDILLYAGLLGGIEIANRYASMGVADSVALKYSAARMGMVSGVLTAIVAAVFSIIALFVVGKTYLIPFCLVCCLFIPWEHVHLNISAVDRGNEKFTRYNFNRFFYATTFPILVVLVFLTGGDRLLAGWLNMEQSVAQLWLMCGLFVISKVIGLLPTLRGMNLVSVLKSGKLATGNTSEIPSARKLLSEGKPFAVSVFATELFERLDIFLIVALATVETSGYYFVAVPAATLLTVAPNALGVFTFNAGANKNRRVSMKQVVGVMSATIALQLVGTLVLMVVLPILIVQPWAYGPEFAPAIPFALWLLPACAIKGFLQAVDGYLKGRGKPMIGVRSRVISIFAMLLFAFFAYRTTKN